MDVHQSIYPIEYSIAVFYRISDPKEYSIAHSYETSYYIVYTIFLQTLHKTFCRITYRI